MDLENIFEAGKPHLKKLVTIKHYLVVFIHTFLVLLVNDSEYSQSKGAKPILSPSGIYLVSPEPHPQARRPKDLCSDQLRALSFLGKKNF